jgi:hypothetical protein
MLWGHKAPLCLVPQSGPQLELIVLGGQQISADSDYRGFGARHEGHLCRFVVSLFVVRTSPKTPG